MSQTTVRCTGANCNALIIWDNLNGRPHPFDTVPCKRCKGKGTTVALQATFEAPAPGTVPCTRCHGKGTVLRSHYETCIDAEYFRKRRVVN